MILLIDTSQETGTVAVSKEGRILFAEENSVAKEHASWLHLAVGRVLAQAGITIRDLKAVAVVAGPGSYTGLRVGMAAAKGFCYAVKIPLITHNTLRVMAESMKDVAREKGCWICPMIDARRDEVFTAIYDSEMHEILTPQAMILDKNSFEKLLSRNQIVFFGSGAAKWQQMKEAITTGHESGRALLLHQIFISQPLMVRVQPLAELSENAFLLKDFADIVYSEPVYLKEFFSY